MLEIFIYAKHRPFDGPPINITDFNIIFINNMKLYYNLKKFSCYSDKKLMY